MSQSLSEQANQQAIEAVRTGKPSSFTVGGSVRDGKLVGGVTYDRTYKNGWGLTAYAKAWWDDLPVSVGTKRPKVEAGAEIVKKF